ncbi:hypothetical protein JW979_08595 [bacterium]|nr:hypothetical protein [candidate division CSSED10-310 bacterium]
MAAVLLDGRNDISTWELQGNEWINTGEITGHGFPFVHITINLSGVLLQQIARYVDDLAPCFDGADTPDECRWELYPNGNPLDPEWNDDSTLFERSFDLLCKPQANFTHKDKLYVLINSSYITPRDHHVFYYPSYAALENKRQGPGGGNPDNWTEEEIRDYKVWYALSPMHYYFKETDAYPLRGIDAEGNDIEDTVEGIKTYGQFTTWGTPDEEWFGSVGETIDVNNPGGYSYGSGEAFEQDGRICRHFTDWDAQMIAIQHYKIMKFIIPIHRKLQTIKCPHDNYPQIEVVTTPYSHPILPLIYDTDNYFDRSAFDARVAAIDFAYHGDGEAATGIFGPDDPEIYNDDAYNQVALGAQQYLNYFGKLPHGMWPGEGSVGESVIYAFRRNGVKWIASGNETCTSSGYADDPGRMYRIDEDSMFLDGDNTDAMSIWFRSESDLIGFDGGYFHSSGCGFNCDGDAWAYNIVENHIIIDWGHDKFWSHTADGENVWGFFHRFGATFFEYTHLPNGQDNYGLYYRLNRANEMIPAELRWYSEYNLHSATPSSAIGIQDSEYVPGGFFPLDAQWELEPLTEGSWVFGDFTTWLGEENENQAWIHLRQTHEDLDAIQAKDFRPHPYRPAPDITIDGRLPYLQWLIWDELYTAEGSDPFWWYGADQSFGSDEIFCNLFRERLVSIYVYARQAGYSMPYPYMQIHPIFSPGDNVNFHHLNGAAFDEDYLYDSEPPPGHGDMILVPPLTEEPAIVPSTLPSDGITPGILTMRVFEEAIENSTISEVYVDLQVLGGQKRTLMLDDGDLFHSGDDTAEDGIYTCRVTVASGINSGQYLLNPTAIDSDGMKTRDFIFITVTEPEPPPPPPDFPKIALAGFLSTYAQRSGNASFVAYIPNTGNSGIDAVNLYYKGTKDAPYTVPILIGTLQDDGQHGDFGPNDGFYGYEIPISSIAEFNKHCYLIEITDLYSRTAICWPYLFIEGD